MHWQGFLESRSYRYVFYASPACTAFQAESILSICILTTAAAATAAAEAEDKYAQQE